MDELLRAERDSIATLGILARTYFLFDPPIAAPGKPTLTHFRGYNVHCLIVDNLDGEVVAADQNQIHLDESPIQHAEQRCIRGAIERLRAKRPRSPDATVEDYYSHSLFAAAGAMPGDFLRKGCTLYNAFDPCAMCAVTLLFAYMKRVSYVIEDYNFTGFYQRVKEQYFSSRESLHGRVDLSAAPTKLTSAVKSLLGTLDQRVTELLGKHVQLIHVLDHSRDILDQAATLLESTSAADLATKDQDFARNKRTLSDVKRYCNLPFRP